MRQPLVKPTCPPNATVQAEFQTFNVHKMLKNSNVVDFEETLVKTKYPLLASIIIGNNGKEQKRENYERRWSNGEFLILTIYDFLDAPHYVEVAYEPTPEVKQNEMLDDSKPENNWQNFLVDPVETSPDSSLGV